MMRVLVTGAAGFIGSSLSEKLLGQGYDVRGIDSYTDYYGREFKERNIAFLTKFKNFKLIEEDILTTDLTKLTDGVEVIFHLAAQAGVRSSWGSEFNIYLNNNVLTTQRLLEASRSSKIRKFVYASSSSVYGNAEKLPVTEGASTRPFSPYGVSKLAGEHLCSLYYQNYGIPTVSLRYFTVYGPRQRPDMAFHKFIKAVLSGQSISIFGEGTQTRDFTFISDIVDATFQAMNAPSGKVYNVGGGNRVSVLDVINLLREISEKEVKIEFMPRQEGDVRDTLSDISETRVDLNYMPKVSLRDGLRSQFQWQVGIYE
ncbi:NAD-dependent epimerase/dehydratase family protein [Paradesulfitobacterium aromaticivorans]